MAEILISDEDWDAPLEEDDLFKVPASTAYQNLTAASLGDADSYAKDLEISQRTGVPVDAINDNRDEVALWDATALIKEEDWNKPLTELENPGVAKYLEDPDSARVSFDDISILTGLENESGRSWIEVNKRVFQGLGDSMMIGMGKTYDQVAILMLNEMKRGKGGGLFSISGGPPIHAAISKARDAAIADMEGDPATQEWNDELDRRIQKHKQNLEFAESMIADLTPQGLTVAEEGLRGGVQMVADMAPGLAISIATRGKFNPTLGYLTAKTFAESYGSGIVAGKEHRTAMQYAAIDAVLEYATERLPQKRLEKIIGEAGAGGGIKSSIKKWLVGEAMGEQIATATQSMNAYAFELDEELAAAYKQGWGEVLEVQGRRQAVTFISTLVGGGSMAATIKGVDHLANRERRAMGKIIQATNKRRGSEFEQERLDNMIYLAQASKTNKRAADQFEKFMETAAPNEIVYMSAEAVDLLDNPPGYILDQMDGSGGDIAIPLATFLKDFANDEAKLALVRPFIKTSEGLNSQKEIEEDQDGEYIKALLAKAAAATETKTAADEIYERITAQLVGTGRQSAATSRQSAAVIIAQVTTQYEYLKSTGFRKEDGTEVTLEEVFATFGLEIVGPEVDIAAEFMTQEELDMSQPAKLQRATEQGFDTKAYWYRGSSYSETRAGLIHASSTEQVADQFGPVRQVWLKTEKMFDIDNAEHISQLAEYLSDPAVQQKFIDTYPDDSGNWMGSWTIEEYINIGLGEGSYTVLEAPVVIDWMKSQGFDAVTMRELEGGAKNVAVFDPSQIRDVEAAFDPAFSESPRVLAQQNFSTIDLVESRVDEAGNALTITENAGVLWQEQQGRKDNINKLRSCLRG